jgi:hypothetical protein
MMGPMPSPDLRARILAAATATPAPSRGSIRREQRIALTCGFIILGAVWYRLGVHPGTRPAAYIATLAGAWLALAAATTWAGVGSGNSMLGRPQAWRAATVLLAPLAMIALWWPIALAWPTTLENESGLFAIEQCLVGTGLLGIGPLLAFLYLARGSEPVRPWLAGAALGVAAGGWGAVALVIICRHASVSHMLIGHVVPVALMAFIGAAIGARALAIRADRG